MATKRCVTEKILREFLGRNFVSGLRTLQPQNFLKNLRPITVFFKSSSVMVLCVDGAWKWDDGWSTSRNSVDDHLRRGLLDVRRRVSGKWSGQLVSRHGTPSYGRRSSLRQGNAEKPWTFSGHCSFLGVIYRENLSQRTKCTPRQSKSQFLGHFLLRVEIWLLM